MRIAGAETADVDVAIVGAGAAGLAAGRHFRALRPELRIRIFEAGRRLGGRAHTLEAGPERLPLDVGCGWLHGGRDNAWTVIATRMGFTLDRSPAPWDGAERNLGIEPEAKKAADRAIAAFFERAEAAPQTGPDQALSDLLEPGCRWNAFIGAVGTFVNGVELERASLRDYQRYDPGRGPDPRVREGYGRLISAYGEALPITLEAPVDRIDHGGADLVLTTGQGTVRARAAIVAVPTNALADEDLRFEPPLEAKLDAASSLPLGLANKLFLAIPEGADLPAEHHLMGRSDSIRTASYHVRPFGRPVIECYFGGALARDLEQAGLPGSVDFAREELRPYFDADVVRRLEPLAASAWAAMPYIHGSYSYAVPGAADLRVQLAQTVDDRIFFAGEACSPNRFSTAHGAYETGLAAAEAVSATLGR